MTFGFLVGSKNFIKFFCVSWEVFVLHGYDCVHCVAKSCTTTAYRWLFRDSLSSLRTLWSAVIELPACSPLSTTVPARLLQEALVMFVFKQISQFGSFGKCEHVHCACPSPVPLFFARDSIDNSWEELEVSRCPSAGFPVALKDYFHRPNFLWTLPASPASHARDHSCTSPSPFLFKFSVFACLGNGFPGNAALTLPLLSPAGFSVPITESCDEDVEVGVFRWDVVFDRWSSGKKTHDPRRASRAKELRVFLPEAQLWQISPTVWHFPWLLLWFAPRRWPSSPSSDSSMSSWSPIRQS